MLASSWRGALRMTHHVQRFRVATLDGLNRLTMSRFQRGILLRRSARRGKPNGRQRRSVFASLTSRAAKFLSSSNPTVSRASSWGRSLVALAGLAHTRPSFVWRQAGTRVSLHRAIGIAQNYCRARLPTRKALSQQIEGEINFLRLTLGPSSPSRNYRPRLTLNACALG